MLVAFSDVERVLEDGVHDPADAEGRLDDVGNDLLHCRGEGGEELNRFPSFPEMFFPKVKLTVQGLLEPLHTHHVLCELERLARRLDGELSANKDTPISPPPPAGGKGKLFFDLYGRRRRSPVLIQQLLLICDVAFIAHGQEIQRYLGILLVGLPHCSLVGFELDDVYDFVQGGGS